MSTGTVFLNNRTQAVRLPADARFPDSVKRVTVRIRGTERVLAPEGSTWDSFFDEATPRVTDDFLAERASQHQPDRDTF